MIYREPSRKRGGGKSKYACFTCRYTVKHGKEKCPTCGGPMENVGTKFKTPPKRDVKEWAILKVWWLDQDLLRTAPHWTGRGRKADTLKLQKERFAENREYAFHHEISKHGHRYGHSKFPYVTFK
jgi:hypothetical protein